VAQPDFDIEKMKDVGPQRQLSAGLLREIAAGRLLV
jgi:hypothetical protein